MTADDQSQTLRSTLVPPQPSDETSEAVFNNERGDISSTEAQDESPESSALAADPEDDDTEEQKSSDTVVTQDVVLSTNKSEELDKSAHSKSQSSGDYLSNKTAEDQADISSTIEKRDFAECHWDERKWYNV